MSGRIARNVWSHRLPESGRLALAGRTGLSDFAQAVDSRLRYHFRHGRPFKHPVIQGNPRLGHLGSHIEDKYRRRAYILKTFRLNARKLRNLLPHTIQGRPRKQKDSPRSPKGLRSQARPTFKDVPGQQRDIFFNWQKGDQVRLVPGGVIAQDDYRIADTDDQTGKITYNIYTIKSANPVNNTCKLEKVTRRVGGKIPLDRNKANVPLGGLQESRFRTEDIVFPLANVQLAVPKDEIIESMEREGVELTSEQRARIPDQVFVVKMETRNVVAPDGRAKIRPHERRGRNPLNWLPDELELAGKAKVFTWERWVTETEPAMHPSMRVDINLPLKTPGSRKIPVEFAPTGFPQPMSNPLATPSTVVLARTWFPSYLDALGPSLDRHDKQIPDAYTESIASASGYIASTYPPASHSRTPPTVLSPPYLAKDPVVDAAFTETEMEQRRTTHGELVEESKRALEDWVQRDNEWKAKAAETSLDPTLPMEFYVQNELCNHYSKPQMQKRFAARHELEALEKEAFVEEAIKEHRKREDRIKQGLEPRVGRVMQTKEVKLTAERRYAEFWVDRKHDREVAAAQRHREKHGPSKAEVKAEKRAHRQAGLADRLRAITLKSSKNQVIPEGLEKLIVPRSADEIRPRV